jgi:hypothetical protein
MVRRGGGRGIGGSVRTPVAGSYIGSGEKGIFSPVVPPFARCSEWQRMITNERVSSLLRRYSEPASALQKDIASTTIVSSSRSKFSSARSAAPRWITACRRLLKRSFSCARRRISDSGPRTCFIKEFLLAFVIWIHSVTPV